MIDDVSIRKTLMTALLIGFMGAAAIGGCAGAADTGSGEHDAAGEESGTMLTPDQTYDEVRNGARLIMRYDAEANAFTGTVRNTTRATLPSVRVEVHLSNGTELGPTTPVDLAPGETIPVRLQAPDTAFTGWTPHAETGPGHGAGGAGGGEHGGEGQSGGEHGTGRERGSEHGGG